MNKEKLSFKDFLDKSTNLIAIFGVLNALFIYALTIENQTVCTFLLPSLFFLSILVWYELIIFSMRSNDGSRKYEIFYFLACTIEIGLIIFMLKEFKSLFLYLCFISLIFVGCYFIFRLIVRLIAGKINIDKIFYLLFIMSLIASGLLLRLVGKPIMSFLGNLLDSLPD